MEINSVREEMNRVWALIDSEAMGSKNSHGAILELKQYFGELDSKTKGIAEIIVSEWVISEEERKRFDALALIDTYKITFAVPNLRMLVEKLSDQSGPSAFYEKEKVAKLINSLMGVSS